MSDDGDPPKDRDVDSRNSNGGVYENLPKLSTPQLVPWIPAGKPKESTFNAYAHKKNQVLAFFNGDHGTHMHLFSIRDDLKVPCVTITYEAT
jgi:hypothetical protein